MSGSSRRNPGDRVQPPERRAYNSPLRRQRVAETRGRILAAGSALVHGFPSWDWRELTFRAVAERAGVSERTVYRHFASEQELHRAVMRRLEEEAGVSYEGLRLADLAEVTARVFASRPKFAVRPASPSEPPFVEEDWRRHQALLGAVAPEARDWSVVELEMAAAVLDVIWAIPAYERLTDVWRLGPADAIQAATWVIGLVAEAIRDGRGPGRPEGRRMRRPAPRRTAAPSDQDGT
jgi:AcrR family transcriptional regulator